MTRQIASDHRRRPSVPARWRILLLLAVVAILVTVGVLVAHSAGQPTAVLRGGLLELEFTTDDQTAQQALARRCGLAEVTQMTPEHVRYTFPASQTNDVLACTRRSLIVRAAALPG